jgi:siroheme synthase
MLEGLIIQQRTDLSHRLSTGAVVDLVVSVAEDGTLLIDVNDSAINLDVNQDEITLLGVAAAKRMGVTVDRLTSVVIQQPRLASII